MKSDRNPAPRHVSLIAIVAVLALQAGCGDSFGRPATVNGNSRPSRLRADASQVAPYRFFSPRSFWNVPIAANASLDPRSTAILANFYAQILHGKESGGRPETTIETSNYSVPVYTVPANQPTVRVKLVNPKVGPSAPYLRSAWSAVPLPTDAHPAAGGDAHLVVWQPSTDRMWEFWRLVDGPEGWYATWGGAMQHVSHNMGVYGPKAWPGATRHWAGWASSLSLVGGLITLDDLELGQINHGLLMAIPNVRAGVYSSPARQEDGTSSNPLALPEGAHLRLDPTLNLAAMHLPQLTLMIARAAQRYGIFVGARGVNVAFYGQDPTPTGTNPYVGAGGYFEGMLPSEVIATFPWQHLELLRMRLHYTARGSLR